jgi:hypothetical protein
MLTWMVWAITLFFGAWGTLGLLVCACFIRAKRCDAEAARAWGERVRAIKKF